MQTTQNIKNYTYPDFNRRQIPQSNFQQPHYNLEQMPEYRGRNDRNNEFQLPQNTNEFMPSFSPNNFDSHLTNNRTNMNKFPPGPGYDYMKSVSESNTLDSMQENFPVRNNSNTLPSPMYFENSGNTNGRQMASGFSSNIANSSQSRGNKELIETQLTNILTTDHKIII